MTDNKEKEGVTVNPKKLQLSKTVGSGSMQSSFGHGRSGKTVTVEVRRNRSISRPDAAKQEQQKAEQMAQHEREIEASGQLGGLTGEERAARLKALQEAAFKKPETRRSPSITDTLSEAQKTEEEKRKSKAAGDSFKKDKAKPGKNLKSTDKLSLGLSDSEEIEIKKNRGEEEKPNKWNEEPRRGKITLANFDEEERVRVRSLASIRRAREKARRKEMEKLGPRETEKIVREVIVPEVISVQELANRMAVRGVDVIKSLMKLGVIATVNQTIDADTAELIVTEFGHKLKRVAESDVENILTNAAVDKGEELQSRPPVVTVMGHVDHGKTSLLDALRKADVAAGEAGGITQHIGAYQIQTQKGERITFIDTPGHEAFTAMRARGAKVTDIVILVVAADDGVMPQTVEAINHARAAQVPIIVAVNKIDKPDANPTKVRDELLSHNLVPEELGGDVLMVPVSAKAKTGLDKLQEAVLLQAEMLNLKSNPNRAATGTVVEAEVDKGRGVMATFLVQKGTLRVGDIVVAGIASGRVRALIDDKGNQVKEAGPSTPVAVLGLTELPNAGDEFASVENDKQAREITEYRLKKIRDVRSLAENKTMDQLFQTAGSGKKELNVVIKADVQGSAEAIIGSLTKLATDEVGVKVVHSAAGAITESDISLSKTLNAMVVGFNVRANAQAKEQAAREHIDIRYYSIIYELVDDVKKILSGMLSPTKREEIIGNAEIREVFNITKAGKVAGCYVKEGIVKRGAGVRLLRDNVVIHEGKLKTLKRFKDDVKEVKEGAECGMAFENYDDIKQGDIIEAFEIIEEQRTL